MTKPCTKKSKVRTVRPAKVTQSHGGALYAGGVPGHRGGPGRPPNEFKARMAALADRGAQALEVSKILDDPEHPLFLEALKWAADRAHGRPTQQVAGDPDQPLTFRIVRE